MTSRPFLLGVRTHGVLLGFLRASHTLAESRRLLDEAARDQTGQDAPRDRSHGLELCHGGIVYAMAQRANAN